MMVVTLLIAITITFVSLQLQRDENQLARLEARRFLLLLEQLREESVLQARPLAVVIDEQTRSYSFNSLPDSDSALVGDVFRQRQVPATLGLEFKLKVTADKDKQSVLVVFPGGEISDFKFRVSGESKSYTVALDDAQSLK